MKQKCGGYFQLPSQKCFQLETQDSGPHYRELFGDMERDSFRVL